MHVVCRVRRRCWHTHGWISSCQLPPQRSSCCCSGPPPSAALSLCWDFPVTPVLDIPLSPPASTASQGIPHLRGNLGLSHRCYLASLQMLCAFSEGLTGPDAFDISSPSNISKFRYCALVKEVWHANNVSCLRYGTRNQENWLLS